MNLQYRQAQPFIISNRVIFLAQTHYMWNITQSSVSTNFKVFILSRVRVEKNPLYPKLYHYITISFSNFRWSLLKNVLKVVFNIIPRSHDSRFFKHYWYKKNISILKMIFEILYFSLGKSKFHEKSMKIFGSVYVCFGYKCDLTFFILDSSLLWLFRNIFSFRKNLKISFQWDLDFWKLQNSSSLNKVLSLKIYTTMQLHQPRGGQYKTRTKSCP